MTHEAMRFLALNSILHGHATLDGFDSLPNMAACLGVSEEEAAKLCLELDKLPRTAPSENKLVAMFLHYFRNNSYTFVAMEQGVVPLHRFMSSDLEGQVSDELRYMFLTRLLMDVERSPLYVDPFIKDGVLHCTPEDFNLVSPAMLEAYQLCLSGIPGTPKGLSSALRKYTSLEHYSRLNAATLLRIIRQMIRVGSHPVVYQQTLLNIPDLLDTYKHTGCLMAFTDATHTSVYWLLDVADSADSTMVMSVELATLQNYLLRDVRDLAGVQVARGYGDGGKILFPGVT